MKPECNRFEQLMLDLAYDEVDDGLAEELREHAAGCARCRQELESIQLTRKLASQLPTPEPPLERDVEILELAADIAAHNREWARGARRESAPGRDLIGVERPIPLIERLRALLLRPALVTAGVACVVFALTFFLGRHMFESESYDQAAHSGAPFHGPAVPIGDLEEAAPAPVDGEALARLTETTTAEQGDRPVGSPQPRAPSKRLGTGGRLKGSPQGSLGTAAEAPRNSAAQLEPQQPAVAAKVEAEPAPFPAEEADALAGPAAADDYAKAKAAPAAPQAAPPPAGGDDTHYYQSGMSAFNRGDCASAVTSLNRVVDPPHDAPALIPSALHHVARCEKRTGRCGKALISYEELLQRFPGYSGRADAMWEAAGCHRRLGHVDRAWALLDQLAQIPGWRDRAVAEQENLKQIKGQQ
jgi:TolA-binding protein